MVILSILAVLLIILILIQTPKGYSAVLAKRIGTKRNKSFVSMATWGVVVGMLILVLLLQ